jgi:ribosomal protein L29
MQLKDKTIEGLQKEVSTLKSNLLAGQKALQAKQGQVEKANESATTAQG